jgi:hypothetical protein
MQSTFLNAVHVSECSPRVWMQSTCQSVVLEHVLAVISSKYIDTIMSNHLQEKLNHFSLEITITFKQVDCLSNC